MTNLGEPAPAHETVTVRRVRTTVSRAAAAGPFRWALAFVAALTQLMACSPGHHAVATPDRALDARWQRAGDVAGPGQWSGADGTASVPLPGGRTAWFFSDTYLGPVNADGSRPAWAGFVHNSVVVQRGDRLSTVAAATPVKPPTGVPGWYWAGAGHVESGRVVEFYHRINGTSLWDFAEQGVALVAFSLPTLRVEDVRELPAGPVVPARSPIMWGAALLDDGDWTYVYGYRAHLDRPTHPKGLYIARAPRGHVSDLLQWRYATGKGWTRDPLRAAELPTLVDAAFGLLKVGGEYALVTRRPSETLADGAMIAYLARSPTGPFTASDSAVIYQAPEPLSGQFVYGARTHPQLTAHGQVVISYNVNTTMTDAACVPQYLRQVSVYRPRFVRVPVGVFRKGYVAPPARKAPTQPGWYATCPIPR